MVLARLSDISRAIIYIWENTKTNNHDKMTILRCMYVAK